LAPQVSGVSRLDRPVSADPLEGFGTQASLRHHFRGEDKKLNPGANPTITSYNASVVNFYNATGSLARFENKKFYLLLLKTL
jgi:hypothetical protein